MKKFLSVLGISSVALVLIVALVAPLRSQVITPGGGTSGGSAFDSMLEILNDVWDSTVHALGVKLKTTLFGEDATNDLIMIGPGTTKVTTFSSMITDTTSDVTTLPNGMKKFVARMANATSESKAFKLTVFGSDVNDISSGFAVCSMATSGSSTQIADQCPATDASYLFYWYVTNLYTSGSNAPLTVYAMY